MGRGTTTNRTATFVAALTAAVLGATVAPVQAADLQEPASETDDGWRVDDGPRGALATWTSSSRLPVTSARPEVTLRGEPLLPVTLAPDGYSLSVPAPSGTSPDDLDVTLSGRQLDAAGERRAPRSERSGAPAAAPQGADLGVDPGEPGPHDVVSSDYDLDPLPFDGFEVPLEVTGHVVRPAPGEGVSGAPLVLFLHGRHQYCYDPTDPEAFPDWPCTDGARPIRSDLGYVYAQELLASQGYTTVSISANGVNAQDHAADDGGALARSALVRRHLGAWADGEVPEASGVDLDRVVLVGHSRGGEGVDLAAQEITRSEPYRVAGEVLVGPVDFARRTAAYVPSVTLLPYCDGDVSDLQGQLYTDTARGLAPGDTALKSSVLVMGANHNYFNSEWTPSETEAPAEDDWWADDATCGAESAPRLSAAGQRAVGAAYVAGAVRTFTRTEPGTAPELAMFDGTPGHVASAGDAVVHSHAVGGGRSLVLPVDLTPTGSDGATVRTCAGYAGSDLRSGCGARIEQSRVPHWAPADPPGLPTQDAVVMTWSRAGAVARLGLGRPWDLSGAAHLDLRAFAAPSLGAATLDVRVEDASGASAVVTPSNGGQVRALPGDSSLGLARLVAQQLRVPLGGVTGVDLERVTAVSLVARNARGKVWVLDLAATPAGLAAVPDRRLPTLRLGDVEVTEASGNGPRQAEVPWTLSAPLAEPAEVALVTAGTEGEVTSRDVEIPAGQTSGGFAVDYVADDVWTGPRSGLVAVYPVSGVSVVDGYGTAAIEDDEPRPRVSVKAPASVREGDPIRIVVTLDRPAGVDVVAEPSFVRPDLAPRAGAADLPATWLRRFTSADRRDAALWERYLELYADVEPGRRSATITIPTRADGVRERAERLRVRVDVPLLDQRFSPTVTVRDR